jgi:hypothetical protein
VCEELEAMTNPFTHPKYIQENLTGRFWQEINEGWDFMQPDMIEYLKEFNSFEET